MGEKQIRPVVKVIEPLQMTDGVGVKLRRSIGTQSLSYLDPFLQFDHFGSRNPEEYQRGFPMHPHRGLETITYVLAGKVKYKDNLGNKEEIITGDVQWITAGRGVIHEEMPQGIGNHMEAFHLWVNLPASLKMCPPRFQEIKDAKIPWMNPMKGVTVRLIAGKIGDVVGPGTGMAGSLLLMDVTVDCDHEFYYEIQHDLTAFAYVFKGSGEYCGTNIEPPRMAVFGEGDYVSIKGGLQRTRFLLVAAKPLGEPVARFGPLVMNTNEEIEQTLREIRNQTFPNSK
jgi:hypothetical protein